MVEIIRLHLKKWPVNALCSAIQNFAKIVQSRDYKWTYDKWGLYQFFSRRDKFAVSKNAYQWYRFDDNTFCEDDWLTESAKDRRIDAKRRISPSAEAIRLAAKMDAREPRKPFQDRKQEAINKLLK
jgi:hypothetical protein